jgi:hypothetical protein
MGAKTQAASSSQPEALSPISSSLEKELIRNSTNSSGTP